MRSIAAATLVLLSLAPSAGRPLAAGPSGVTKIAITSRGPAFGGREFGRVGAYEQIKGVASGEIDPADRRNTVITDPLSAPASESRASRAATYTCWNPIASGPLKGRERSLAGGYIPFAKTRAERQASGDPRLSIEERYASLDAYLALAAKQADELVKQRFLLPDDAARLLKQARADMEATGLLK